MYTSSKNLFSEGPESAVDFTESSGHTNQGERIRRLVLSFPNLSMFLFGPQLRILDGEVFSLHGKLTSRGTLVNPHPHSFLDLNLEFFHPIFG